MRNLTSASALLVLSLLLVGCANPWEKNFQPNPTLEGSAKLPPTPHVDVRVVEFERLTNYENKERDERVQSATSPSDYTPEQRTAAKNRLLEALQLKERGEDIQILGWSRFMETQPLDPRDSELQEFARKIGADVVVTSVGYTGQVNRIVDYPLTSYSNFYTTGRGRRGALYSGSSYSTVWVPTSVTENQYYHQAVFLRRQ